MLLVPEQAFLSPILAGRDAEVSRLRRLFERARDGSGQTLLVSGEAGIGKSRLVSEAKAIARQHTFTILQGSCFEPDRTLLFAPFIDLLRLVDLTTLAAFPHLVPHLLKLDPELVMYFPDVVPAPAAEPEQEKRMLLHTWRSLLVEQASLLQPFEPGRLIIIEDLHWCDDVSLELLLLIARTIQTKPVALLLTYRSDEATPMLAQFLSDLDRERLAGEVALKPLAVEHVAEIIRATFNQPQPISGEFVAALYDHTEGNPFFIEEVLKSLVTSGDIFFANGSWDRKRVNELRVPRTVQVAVAQRTGRLSPDARRVLTLAAVAGRRFDIVLLATITDLPERDLVAVIKELLAAQLVKEESGDIFAFRHALTQQAVYDALLVRERKVLHRAVAEQMEQASAAEIEMRLADLSWHYFRSEVWDKSLSYSRRAGVGAQALYSLRIAAEYYTRAIVSAQAQGDAESLRIVQYVRGQVHEQLGEFEAARMDYEAARGAACSGNDQQTEWQAVLGLGFLWASRDYTRAGDYFQQALDLAAQLDDTVLAAHTLNRVGNWHMNAERPHEAIQYHREALRLFEALGDRRGIASTLDLLGITHYIVGDFQRSIGLYQSAVTEFREAQDTGGLLTALIIGSSRGTAFISRTVIPIRSFLAERVSECEEGLLLAVEIGARPAEALGRVWLGFNYAMAGQYMTAFRHVRHGLAIAQAIEHEHFICTAHMVLGVLYWDLAAWQAARTHLEQAHTLARTTHSTIWQHHTAAFLVSSLVQLGLVNEADSILRSEWSAETAMNSIGLRQLWGARAEVLLARHDPQQAVVVIEQLIELCSEHGYTWWLCCPVPCTAAGGCTGSAEPYARGCAPSGTGLECGQGR